MFIYFFVATLALSTVLFPNRKYMGMVICVFAVIAGARDGVLGYDFSVYQTYYNAINIDGNIFGYEPGYYYLNQLFNSAGLPFNYLLFFVSVLFHLGLLIILFCLRDHVGINPGWVLFFYVTSGFYFWHAYTFVRQSLAITIFYVSMSMPLGRALFVNAVAPLFHVSGVVNFLVLAFAKARSRIAPWSLAVLAASGLVLGLVMIEYLRKKVAAYDVDFTATWLMVVETLLQGVLLSFLLPSNKLMSTLKVIIAVSVAFSLLGFFYNAIFIRFIEPFKIIMLMAYAVALLRFRGIDQRWYCLTVMVVILFSYLRLYRFLTTFGDYALPFQFMSLQ